MTMYKEFETLEDGKKALKDHVKLRNQMGGAMYYNMLNDECCQIANKLRSLGGDYSEIAEILGTGTFQ